MSIGIRNLFIIAQICGVINFITYGMNIWMKNKTCTNKKSERRHCVPIEHCNTSKEMLNKYIENQN